MDAKELPIEQVKMALESGVPQVFFYINKNGAFVGVDTRGAKPVVRVLGKKSFLEKWLKERE